MTATYTYDPAGQQTAATGTSSATNPLRYTQGLLDEQTGWIKHGVRFHDTATANWTAQDPLSQIMNPDSASRYAYADSNTINRIDPTGLATGCDYFGGLVGAGAGAAWGYVGGPWAGALGGYWYGIWATDWCNEGGSPHPYDGPDKYDWPTD
ncbi:RHS repeat-associated core domain-containing protein [Kribbella sp. NPDC051587]|uniref:RHS repeat-associated core domain-containing protein n=1 Tax=Kribbella sp. NPDC051587 TaxID=3364119 RepID=UPI00378AF352